jgi:hypothetical protein
MAKKSDSSKSADDKGQVFIFVPFTKIEDGPTPAGEAINYATIRESAQKWATAMSKEHGADSRKVPVIVSFDSDRTSKEAHDKKKAELKQAKDGLSPLGKISSFLGFNSEINKLESETRTAKKAAEHHAKLHDQLKGAGSNDTVYVLGHTGVGGNAMATSSHTRVGTDEIAKRMLGSIGQDVGKIKVWGCNSGSDGIDRSNGTHHDSVAKRLNQATSSHFSKAEYFGYTKTVGVDVKDNKKYAKIEGADGTDEQVKASGHRVKVGDSLKSGTPAKSSQQAQQPGIRR